MSPEASLHLDKARSLLETAGELLQCAFWGAAAREAYLAAYQAAQAYIFDHAGRAAKTHSGAHSQFAQLARLEPRIGADLRSFLGEAYNLKTAADYLLGEDAEIAPEQAGAAVEKAGRFVECIASLLTADGKE